MGGFMLVDGLIVIAGEKSLRLAYLIPAPFFGYLIGFLLACIFAPRKLQTASFTLIILLAFLRIPLPYIEGAFVGCTLFAAFLSFDRTRRQFIGILLQAFVPALLIALAIRTVMLTGSLGHDPAAAWVLPLAPTIPLIITFWALPYGKKLYWRDSWRSLPAPPALPPLSQLDVNNNPCYGLLPGQSPAKGMILWLAAWPCCFFTLSLAAWSYHQFLDNHLSPASGIYIVSISISAIAFDQSRKMFLRARRHIKPAIASPKHLPPGSYVLYLRPFKDDIPRAAVKERLSRTPPLSMDPMGNLIDLVMSSKDEEEHIADALSPVGPLVAVGTPEEIRLFAGAMRMYLPKDSWKEPVKQLIHGSRLTALTLGSSKGTMWEIAESMRSLPPQRLLLMVPRGIGKREYEMIRETTDLALRKPSTDDMSHAWKNATPPSLPPYSSLKLHKDPAISIIRFSADWEPTITRASYMNDAPWLNLFTHLTRVLRPAFVQLAAYESETGKRFG
ncbi:hypothetical protein ACFXPI_03535 [Streptomyces sp. NPDC059104]|uniref:hypothetical protein n=1 Tax=Streptomyces sp. NPDC059104 TaxID=3346729 RepID=UPI00367843F7